MTKENTNRGRFIVFEGLDGSGKSTQIDLLCERLKKEGRSVVKTAEPTMLTTGGIIRDALAGNYQRSPEELSALFLADRIAHNVNPKNGIINLLSEGTDVVCDRYYYSSFAYQGMDCDIDWVIDMNIKCPSVTKPDVCFFIDVPTEICKERVDKRGGFREIFEREQNTLERVRAKYAEVFRKLENENIVLINSEGSPADIAKVIYSSLPQFAL